jgi:hypothetical protein
MVSVTTGVETMSGTVRSAGTIEQRRVDELDEPAQTLTYEERLLIAERIVAALRAEGFDCERAEETSAH